MNRKVLAKQLVALAKALTAEDAADPKSKWNQESKHVVDRLVARLPEYAKQIASSAGKYGSDPQKYKPQLDVLKTTVWDTYKLSRVVLRSLGEDVP